MKAVAWFEVNLKVAIGNAGYELTSGLGDHADHPGVEGLLSDDLADGYVHRLVREDSLPIQSIIAEVSDESAAILQFYDALPMLLETLMVPFVGVTILVFDTAKRVL